MSLKKYLKRKICGQSFIEYALLVGVSVIVILFLLSPAGGEKILKSTKDGAFTRHFEAVKASITGN